MILRHMNKIADIAFFLLFASELTFYLLILQTGIVELHHADMHEIWMVPVGGIIGIISSIFLYKERRWLVPMLLASQTLLAFEYSHASGLILFSFGLISGMTAPLLIARIDALFWAAVALALSYTYGTYHFQVPADERMSIAVLLSIIAFGASLFAQMGRTRKATQGLEGKGTATIFLWLLLDASLFETLSRDPSMSIWGHAHFTWSIIALHLVGVVSAYRLRDWKHNDLSILLLFTITYGLYASHWQVGLSIVYPFVISYYNIILLNRLKQIRYRELALVSLGFWAASGSGLMIALSQELLFAWSTLTMLGFICLSQRKSHEDISLSIPSHRIMASGR